jgi:hypothetical protein|tara:strand:+ start:83 stop:322 length:240 start_codon:yes stop_codon:yes gene_type:complete
VQCFAINRADVIHFFRGNQVVQELRDQTAGFYDSPDQVKEAHDTKIRQDKVFNEIKNEAFGRKYKQRANIMDKKAKARR